MNKCLVKWSGSKRIQASRIVDLFPDEIDTYYEPFMGGASVLIELLLRSDKAVNNYIASDLNAHVVSLFNLIKDNPSKLIESYEENWKYMNSEQDGKNDRYLEIRDRFNENFSPEDFYFLTKTCYTGLIRFNRKGQFNVGYHFGRSGEKPDSVSESVHFYSDLLNRKNVIFKCKSYSEINPNVDDFVYFDPPYDNTKQTMYLGGFEKDKFFDFCRSLSCKYAISYDGGVVGESASASIPSDIFKEAVAIDAMRNMRQTFKSDKYKTEITSKTLQRFEMLYLNYEQHDTVKLVSHKLF
jgi:DNA adenine methylase